MEEGRRSAITAIPSAGPSCDGAISTRSAERSDVTCTTSPTGESAIVPCRFLERGTPSAAVGNHGLDHLCAMSDHGTALTGAAAGRRSAASTESIRMGPDAHPLSITSPSSTSAAQPVLRSRFTGKEKLSSFSEYLYSFKQQLTQPNSQYHITDNLIHPSPILNHHQSATVGQYRPGIQPLQPAEMLSDPLNNYSRSNHGVGSSSRTGLLPSSTSSLTEKEIWMMIVDRMRGEIMRARDTNRIEGNHNSIYCRASSISPSNYELEHRNAAEKHNNQYSCTVCSPLGDNRAVAKTICGHYLCWDCLCKWHKKDAPTTLSSRRKKCPCCAKILTKSQMTMIGELNIDNLSSLVQDQRDELLQAIAIPILSSTLQQGSSHFDSAASSSMNDTHVDSQCNDQLVIDNYVITNSSSAQGIRCEPSPSHILERTASSSVDDEFLYQLLAGFEEDQFCSGEHKQALQAETDLITMPSGSHVQTSQDVRTPAVPTDIDIVHNGSYDSAETYIQSHLNAISQSQPPQFANVNMRNVEASLFGDCELAGPMTALSHCTDSQFPAMNILQTAPPIAPPNDQLWSWPSAVTGSSHNESFAYYGSNVDFNADKGEEGTLSSLVKSASRVIQKNDTTASLDCARQQMIAKSSSSHEYNMAGRISTTTYLGNIQSHMESVPEENLHLVQLIGELDNMDETMQLRQAGAMKQSITLPHNYPPTMGYWERLLSMLPAQPAGASTCQEYSTAHARMTYINGSLNQLNTCASFNDEQLPAANYCSQNVYIVNQQEQSAVAAAATPCYNSSAPFITSYTSTGAGHVSHINRLDADADY